MDIETFRDHLRTFLANEPISKNALAKRAGVPQSQVSDWSRGKGQRFTTNAKRVMDAIEDYRRQAEADERKRERKYEPIPKDIEDAVQSILEVAPQKANLILDVLSALQRNNS